MRQDAEPEARFMRTTETNDTRSLLPMAEAAKQARGDPESLQVVADVVYSNGE